MDYTSEHYKGRADRDNYPDQITPDYGIGVTFKDDKGIEYTTVQRQSEAKICVRARSYSGSMGAVHCYARITVYSPSLSFIKNGELAVCSLSGSFDRFKPENVKGIEIEVLREITEYDIKKGTRYNKERFKGYRVGDLVNAFDTEEELSKAIKELIRQRFTGNWKVEIEGFDDEALNVGYDYENDNIVEVSLEEYLK